MDMLRLRSARLVAATIVIMSGLIGCSATEEVSTDEGQPDDGATTMDPEAEGSEEPDTDDPEALGPTGRLQLTGFREDNPAGASVQLRAVEVDGAGNVLIDVEAVSVRASVQIGRYSNLLEDDLGNRYELIDVEDNLELSLGAAERMTGTLAFAGPVDPDAMSFTFALNQVGSSFEAGAEQPVNQFPRFLITDVPFPGVGAEAEAVTEGSLLEPAVVEVGETLTSDDNPDVEVTVVSVTNDGRSILIELEAVNSSGTVVRIVNDAPRLRDHTGTTFQFLRDESGEEETRKLELEPGSEATATLAFLGTVGPAATELELVLNGLGIDRGQPGRPGFRTTLPVPGAEEAP